VQKKQAFETLPLKNGIKLAVQGGWGATPFCKFSCFPIIKEKKFFSNSISENLKIRGF
jgi:hypothetical protein